MLTLSFLNPRVSNRLSFVLPREPLALVLSCLFLCRAVGWNGGVLPLCRAVSSCPIISRRYNVGMLLWKFGVSWNSCCDPSCRKLATAALIYAVYRTLLLLRSGQLLVPLSHRNCSLILTRLLDFSSVKISFIS